MNDRMDHRGFQNVEEMNEYMISRWNSKVKNDDFVIIGNLSGENAEETNVLLRRLNGRLYFNEVVTDKNTGFPVPEYLDKQDSIRFFQEYGRLQIKRRRAGERQYL